MPRSAVAGAFFALVAALAGIAAHGLAEGDPVAPSFDALFLLTAGVLALGALGGGAAAAVSGWIARRTGSRTARMRRTAGISPVGVLLPVVAGQWFSHVVMVGDHEIRAAQAAASGAGVALGHAHGAGAGAGAGVASAAGAHGSAGAPGHAAAAGAADAAAAGHATAWLPMLAAHVVGVLVCLVLLALLNRVLDVVATRVLSTPRQIAVPPRAPLTRRRPLVLPVCTRRSAAAPRAPPLQPTA